MKEMSDINALLKEFVGDIEEKSYLCTRKEYAKGSLNLYGAVHSKHYALVC